MAYVVSDGVLEFRQSGVQFGLCLGVNSLITQHPDAIFEARRWQGDGVHLTRWHIRWKSAIRFFPYDGTGFSLSRMVWCSPSAPLWYKPRHERQTALDGALSASGGRTGP